LTSLREREVSGLNDSRLYEIAPPAAGEITVLGSKSGYR
jgi:hypothetical protein